jgi:hypothetical protein
MKETVAIKLLKQGGDLGIASGITAEQQAISSTLYSFNFNIVHSFNVKIIYSFNFNIIFLKRQHHTSLQIQHYVFL